MFINNVPFFPDGNGHPAQEYRVYIGRVNTDPTQEANKLAITDGIDGKPVSNPFRINGSGFPRNANGSVINPYIQGTEYCIEYRSPVGEIGSLLWRNPYFRAEGASGTTETGGDGVVGLSVESFQIAKTLDLSDYSSVYIQSYASAWQDTAAGPIGDFYAYKTGSTGAPSTGHPGVFYDSAGNEWKPLPSQKLYAEMFGAVTGIGNDSFQAFKDMLETASTLRVPCYAEGSEYLINTQATTDSNYSLFDKYAIKLPDYVDLRGGGDTVIKNASIASEQYFFVAEDCTYVSIKDCKLSGNAGANAISGCLYVAGCDDVYLDVVVDDSAPIYFTASPNKQTLRVRGSLEVSNAENYAVSLDSAGARDVQLDTLIIRDSDNGLYLSSKDIDAHAVTIERPQVKVTNLDIVNTGTALKIISADFYFSNITGNGNTNGIVFEPDTDIGIFSGSTINLNASNFMTFTFDTANIDMLSVDSIVTNTTNLIICNTTTTGRLKDAVINSLFARGTGAGNGVEFNSDIQLIDVFTINFIDIDGFARGFYLGDLTQTGIIKCLSGTLNSCTTGIDLSARDAQKIEVRNVDFSGTTTEIDTIANASWRASGCKGFTVNDVASAYNAFVTEQTYGTYEILTVNYLRENDGVEILKKGTYVAANSGLNSTVHKRSLTYSANNSAVLGIHSSDNPFAGGANAIPSTMTVSLTKEEW